MIIAVCAVLFATATWIIRSDQASKAIERAADSSDQLAETETKLVESDEQSTTLRRKFADSLTSIEKLERELRATQAELESVKREREAYEAALTDAKKKDAHPGSLVRATLREAVGDLVDVVANARVIDEDGQTKLSEGAMLEFLKQDSRSKCVVTFAETGDIGLGLNIAAATSIDETTALSVALRLVKAWKVPGASKQYHVVLWQSHSVGLCAQPQAANFAEQLIAGLVDSLAAELQK